MVNIGHDVTDIAVQTHILLRVYLFSGKTTGRSLKEMDPYEVATSWWISVASRAVC